MRRLTLIALLFAAACSDDSDTPSGHELARTTELHQYNSCSDLETDLKGVLTQQAFADIDNIDRWGYGAEDSAGAPSNGGDSSSSGGGRTEGTDYSGTNNQEQGVDEADLVKSDGYHLYALNGHQLHIFGTPNFGDLVPESVTNIEGSPTEMLLDANANRAVVFSIIDVYSLPDGHPLKQLVGWQDDQWYWRIAQLTKITVIDITDRTKPSLVREVFFEGWYDTARKVDNTVRMAAYSWLELPWAYGYYDYYWNHGRDKDETKAWIAQRIQRMHLTDMIPEMYVRTPNGQFVTNSLSTSSCQSFYRPSDSHARGIASVISFDLLGNDFFYDADHVISNWPTFYESQDRFVIAESAHDYWWYWWFQDDPPQTNIHVFDSSQAGKSSYIGSGRIDGTILDQFSLDEQDGNIRVAATTGGWWHYQTQSEDPVENHVYVLSPDGNHYKIAGSVDGITPGERLQASRFLGNNGYLVTFKYTDPLVTLDLSDATNPHVVGELQVPGYSTYLHPMGDHGLLSIGVDNTQSWTTNISTFDVSNQAQPSRTSNLPLNPPDGGWSWSEALWEHKAFNYWAPKGLLAIPASNYEQTSQYNWKYVSKLRLVSVDANSGALTLHGEIDHTPYYNQDQYWSILDIRRSVFMGDYIYAISDKAISVHQTDDLTKVNEALLPGHQDGDYWWWW